MERTLQRHIGGSPRVVALRRHNGQDDAHGQTSLPAGFSLESAMPMYEGGGWQQTFFADGADWYFAVNQRPEGSFHGTDEQVGTVTVRGIEADVWDGMNYTMRTIHWVEDGLDLQVWGEIQGPPTYTHEDELLAIAESVQLPD